jgi:crotonobetainyl-CoA:carnitine CoA-transferase CaiB-like acyl-CoA transferase
VPAVNGTEDHPAKAGLSIVDIATGMYALNGILMALFRRERTGQGTAFEVSLFDSITEWMSFPAYYTSGSGKPLKRSGLRHATVAPYGPVRTGDGRTIFFGIQNEREWIDLCDKVLNDRPLAHDPRFATNPDRIKNRDALESTIEKHFARFTADEAMARLEAASIANANLNSVESFLQHPQLHERGRMRAVDTPCGPLQAFVPAVTIPGMEPVMGPVPSVGQQTSAIVAELGLVDVEAK